MLYKEQGSTAEKFGFYLPIKSALRKNKRTPKLKIKKKEKGLFLV